MLRLTFTLIVGLWAVFAIWGDPVEAVATAPDAENAQSTSVRTAGVIVYRTPTLLTPGTATQASSRGLTAPLLPSANVSPIAVSLRQPEQPFAPAAPVAAPQADLLPLYTVTGTRVNMRAGPSTANPVVGALALGSVTEALGPEIDGWVEIRDLDSGVSGFMATRFLNPL